MCGLCGVLSLSTTSAYEEQIFSELLIVNTLRGEFGVGAAMVPALSSRQNRVIRSISDCLDYDFQTELGRAMKKGPIMLMGHTRSPTTGGSGLDCVHPIEAGHILGTHNGTMKSVAGENVGKRFDSRLLFEALRDKGPAETIKTSEGAYALVWLNDKTHTLNMIRNVYRPLAVAYATEFPGTMFWSSEAGALRYILNRHGCAKPEIYSVPEDKLVTWTIRGKSISPTWEGEIKSLTPQKVLMELTAEDVAPPLLTAGVRLISRSIKGHTLVFHRTRGDRGVEEGALKMLLAKGCSLCSAQALWQDFRQGRLHWVDREEFICSDCEKTPNGRSIIDNATVDHTTH